MPNPEPAEPTRRERLAQVTEFLGKTSAGADATSDSRKAAACIGCSDSAFGLVFLEEHEALGKVGRDNYLTLEIAGKSYFLSSWAVYDPDQQRRVIVELTYRLLFEPAVFNDPFIHCGGRILGNVLLDSSGEFAKQGDRGRPRITAMPTLPEIAKALREVGYFEDDKTNSELIKHVRGCLPGRA